MIMGETEEAVANAEKEVKTIIFSSNDEKNSMRKLQLRVAQEMNKTMYSNKGQSFD